MPASQVTLQRSDLDILEFAPQAGARLLAEAEISEAADLPPSALLTDEVSQPLTWGIGPYLEQSFFDPDEPWRFEIGLEATAAYRFTPNLTLSGTVSKEIIGTIADSDRESNSVLPRVRTDRILYAQEGDPGIEDLVLAYTFRPGEDFYGRVTTGYLEAMFGGVSAELLWKLARSSSPKGISASGSS